MEFGLANKNVFIYLPKKQQQNQWKCTEINNNIEMQNNLIEEKNHSKSGNRKKQTEIEEKCENDTKKVENSKPNELNLICNACENQSIYD